MVYIVIVVCIFICKLKIIVNGEYIIIIIVGVYIVIFLLFKILVIEVYCEFIVMK